MDECCQLTDKDSYEDCKYKYDILIRLRDHEHTVLWQKFNVFLGSNTIIVAIIAGVLSFQEFRGNPQTAQNIIESTAQKVGSYNFQTTTGRPNGTWNNEMGYGLVDAFASVQATMCPGTTTISNVT